MDRLIRSPIRSDHDGPPHARSHARQHGLSRGIAVKVTGTSTVHHGFQRIGHLPLATRHTLLHSSVRLRRLYYLKYSRKTDHPVEPGIVCAILIDACGTIQTLMGLDLPDERSARHQRDPLRLIR